MFFSLLAYDFGCLYTSLVIYIFLFNNKNPFSYKSFSFLWWNALACWFVVFHFLGHFLFLFWLMFPETFKYFFLFRFNKMSHGIIMLSLVANDILNTNFWTFFLFHPFDLYSYSFSLFIRLGTCILELRLNICENKLNQVN